MRTFASLSLMALLVCGVAVAEQPSPTPDAKTQKVLKQLMGRWEIEEGVNQGRELSEDDLEGTVVIVDKQYIRTIDRDQKERYKAIYKIDASKDPIQINMTSAMKGVPPAQSLGILELEDDGEEWELCYALPGNPRPKDFESEEGSKVMLFEMEKEDD